MCRNVPGKISVCKKIGRCFTGISVFTKCGKKCGHRSDTYSFLKTGDTSPHGEKQFWSGDRGRSGQKMDKSLCCKKTQAKAEYADLELAGLNELRGLWGLSVVVWYLTLG